MVVIRNLLLALILTLTLSSHYFHVAGSARADDHEGPKADDNYNYADDDYEDCRGDNDCTGKTFESKSLLNKIKEYSPSLEALFGSEKLVQSQVLDWIGNTTQSYWKVEQAAYDLTQALNNTVKTRELHGSQLRKCNLVLEMLNNATSVLNNERSFYEAINRDRNDLNCLLGRAAVNREFARIEECADSYICEYCLNHLWSEISSHYEPVKSAANCEVKKALETLILLDNHYKDNVSAIDPERIQFLYSITNPSHKQLLKGFGCNEEKCDVLCFQPSESELNSLISDLEIRYSDPSSFTTVSEMSALFEFQHDLALINEKLIKRGSGERMLQVANSMLNVYMNMLDNAIGEESHVWQDVTDTEKNKELETLLFRNEEYIGDASYILLNGDEGREYVNRSTEQIQISMTQVQNKQNEDSQVTFDFEGSKIWTNEKATNDTLNVYAIHYKSWKENLACKRGNASNNNESSPLFGNRTFVGKGGILSLSTRINNKKKSVPVMYKIDFSDEEKADTKLPPDSEGQIQERVKYRCLSCQYLDPVLGEWRTTGCTVDKVDDEGITCNCNHTTNFAAFMSPFSPDYTTTKAQDRWLNMMEYVGSCLTIISLIVALVIFFIVRKAVRNDRMKAHVNLSIALICLHAVQLGSDSAISDNMGCLVVTILTHYFILATFLWMFVEGVFLYLYVVQVFIHSRLDNNVWMYLTGWGFPVLVVAISAGVGVPLDVYVERRKTSSSNYCPDGELLFPPHPLENQKYEICWLDSQSGMTWSFIAPALLIITFNFLILGKVVQVLVKMTKRQNAMTTFKGNSNVGRRTYSTDTNSSGGKKPHQQQSMIASPQYPSTTGNKYYNSPKNSTEDMHLESLHGNQSKSQPHSNIMHSRAASQSHSQNNLVDASPNANHSKFISDVQTAVKGAFVLLPLLGIPWLLGVFGYANYALTVIFVVCNSLQGFGIFMVYCIFNGEVQRALKRYANQRRLLMNPGRDRFTSTSSANGGKSFFRSWRRRSTHVSTLPSSG